MLEQIILMQVVASADHCGQIPEGVGTIFTIHYVILKATFLQNSCKFCPMKFSDFSQGMCYEFCVHYCYRRMLE